MKERRTILNSTVPIRYAEKPSIILILHLARLDVETYTFSHDRYSQDVYARALHLSNLL